ncbi:MAG: hypothetical protein M3274_04885 [Actinomycetota bacterium]|nr:hypothetical protein [Actinomycetota bacterium]
MGEKGFGAYARICAHPEPMRYLPGTMTPEQTEEQMARFGRHREERGLGCGLSKMKRPARSWLRQLAYHHAWPEGEHNTEVGRRLDRSY